MEKGSTIHGLIPLGQNPDLATRLERLHREGWVSGDASDFLEMPREEIEILDLRRSLANGIRQTRKSNKMTQSQLAIRIKSSQSRIAKMEAGDPSVSVDLMVKCLFSLGVNKNELARFILN